MSMGTTISTNDLIGMTLEDAEKKCESKKVVQGKTKILFVRVERKDGKSLSGNTLCGETWFSLLKSNRSNKSLWNTTFRTACVSLLNNCSKSIGEISRSVLRNMETWCHNRSGWTLAPGTMKEVEVFNNGVTEHPLCPLNHSTEGTTSPTQVHERLNSMTLEEGLKQAQFHIKILFALCAILFFVMIYTLRKVFITNRLQQQLLSQ